MAQRPKPVPFFRNFYVQIRRLLYFSRFCWCMAIPKIWKSEIVGNVANGNNEPVPSLDISSTKKAHMMLAERSFTPPIAEISLRKQVLNVKAVYKLPFKVTVENKLRSFQFKLIHNIIPTNHSLYKMNIKVSPRCKCCLFPNETLIHMLF